MFEKLHQYININSHGIEFYGYVVDYNYKRVTLSAHNRNTCLNREPS